MNIQATPQAKELYELLLKKVISQDLLKLEKFDGFKTIDIAIPKAKINIEIDGSQHNLSSKQALSDLQRTYFSFRKGYFTLRIPNSLIKEHINQTAGMIVVMIEETLRKKKETKSKSNIYP